MTLIGLLALREGNMLASSIVFPEEVLAEQLNINIDPESCDTAYESIAILKKAFRDNVLRTTYFPGDNVAFDLVQVRKKIMKKLPECFSGENSVSWTINSPSGGFSFYTAIRGPFDYKGKEIEASTVDQKLHLPLNLELWKSAYSNYRK